MGCINCLYICLYAEFEILQTARLAVCGLYMPLWTEGFWARNGTRETGDRWKGRTGVPHQLAETKRNPLIRGRI